MSTNGQKIIWKQECIPVGCVLHACCPYVPACTARGGGNCPVGDGGVPALGVYLLGVYLSGGCTCLGGYLPRGRVPAKVRSL